MRQDALCFPSRSPIHRCGLMLRYFREAGPAGWRQAEDYEVEVDCFSGLGATLVLIF